MIETMRTRDIRIRLVPVPGQTDGTAFSIRFDYRDARKAQQTVQALMTNFMDANLSPARAGATPYVGSRKAGINVDVLQAPTLSASPVQPNRSIFAATGFGAGFVIAAIIAVFRRRFVSELRAA